MLWAWGKLKVKEKDVGKDMLYDMFAYRDIYGDKCVIKTIYIYICNISNTFL